MLSCLASYRMTTTLTDMLMEGQCVCVCVCECVCSLLLQPKLPLHADRQAFSASFAHLEQRLSSCNSIDDAFNKCVCLMPSCSPPPNPPPPFPLMQFSVAWPLTWSSDLPGADRSSVVQLWNKTLCVCVCEHICAPLTTSWRSCEHFEWKTPDRHNLLVSS